MKVSREELLSELKFRSGTYHIDDVYSDFNEFKGLTGINRDMMAAIMAKVINTMSDGELMAAIVTRKVEGTSEGLTTRCMIYAARKRGLADAEDN